MRRVPSTFIALTLLLTGLNTPAQSPNQTTPQTSAPTLKVYSRETIVDVTVTDAHGSPVHGLNQSDFNLKEDGKPQPIRGFHEYATEPVPAPPTLPPNVYTNLQIPPPSSAVNVLLLDFVSTAPVLSASCCRTKPNAGPKDLARAMERQHLVKQEATKYLYKMPVGTRIAVLGMSEPGSLRILQTTTSDPGLLSAAIDTMEYNMTGKADYDPNLVGALVQTWCAQQNQRNRMILESLDQIAADLASIKGRKNLIWFTTGIPTMTDPAQSPGCLSDFTQDRNKALGLLTAAQVTVFPVGAQGVGDGAGPPYAESSAAEDLSMEAIAEATGGTAFYNTNDLAGAIAKAIATGSDYYTLTYVPPGAEYDGRHHTINLKLNADSTHPGLHLTYRNNYYAEDPRKISPVPGLTLAGVPASAGDHKVDIKAAMSRNLPTSTQLLFDLKVEPSTLPAQPVDPPVFGTLDPKLKKDHLTRYLVRYAVPASQLTFADAPGNTHKGSVELDLAAYDAHGSLVTGLSQTVNMPLSEAKYQEFIQGPFRFSQQIDLPSGPLFLRIGVLDATSNKIGTLEIPLTVPKK